MKVIILFLSMLLICSYCQAQNKPKYIITVVKKSKHKVRGVFYAITDHELVLLKHNTKTIKVEFSNVKDIYINKKGVILPFMLLGAGVVLVAATQEKLPLDQFALLIAGVPVGAVVGNLVGQLFANKRFYRKLELHDFPNIRADLEKYTQAIYSPL
jgi:hypothetical protein